MLRILFLVIVSAAFTAPLFSQPPAASDPLSVRLLQARQYLAEHKPDLAAQEYEAVLAADPENLEAQGNLGVVLFFQNQCSAAIGHLQSALRLQPQLGKMQALLGVCQKREGMAEDAKRNLEASLLSVKEQKILELVDTNLVEIYYAEGNLALASSRAEDLLKMDPHDPNVLFMTYRIHTDIAEAARNALVAIAPDSPRMQQLMAEHFINLGDAPNAVVQYKRAFATDPNLPGLRYELAGAIFQESHAEASLTRAQELFAEVLREEPNNAGAEARLGQIAMIRNHPELAEKHFSRALTLQANEFNALVGMSEIALIRKDDASAATYLSRASQVNPLDDRLHYRLALLYRNLGRTQDANREMDTFMKVRALKANVRAIDQRVVPQQ